MARWTGMILGTLILLAACGCYTQRKIYVINGKNFDETKRNVIELGASRADVIELLGKPQAEHVNDETGNLELVYFFERNQTREQVIFGVTSEHENTVHKELKVLLYNDRVKEMNYEDSMNVD